MKIAVLGGGSSYTPELVDGLLRRQLPVDEVWLVDVPEGRHKVDTIAGLARRMAERLGRQVRFPVTEDRRAALDGASFVLSQLRVGGLEMRAQDERIPLRHGLLGQETTGAGGFANALRTIPVALRVAEEMATLAPQAWLLNFTNPAGLVTQAICSAGYRQAVGLCNIARITERRLALRAHVPEESVELEAAGLNHLTGSWMRVAGQDVTPLALASGAPDEELRQVAAEFEPPQGFFAGLDFFPNPYLNYFFFPGPTLRHAEASAASADGTRAQRVQAIEAQLFRRYADSSLAEKPAELAQRGGAYYSEVAVDAMAALLGIQPATLVLNLPNGGALREFDDDDVVERNAEVSLAGIRPVPRQAPMPRLLRGIALAVKEYERLCVEAAVRGSRRKALEALMCHPLIGAADVAVGLLDDLAAANRGYWPDLR